MRNNKINRILDKGVWLHSKEEICNYFVRAFDSLFRSTNLIIADEIRELGRAEVSEADNNGIMAIPSVE